jgi:hypothetical protein
MAATIAAIPKPDSCRTPKRPDPAAPLRGRMSPHGRALESLRPARAGARRQHDGGRRHLPGARRGREEPDRRRPDPRQERAEPGQNPGGRHVGHAPAPDRARPGPPGEARAAGCPRPTTEAGPGRLEVAEETLRPSAGAADAVVEGREEGTPMPPDGADQVYRAPWSARGGGRHDFRRRAVLQRGLARLGHPCDRSATPCGTSTAVPRPAGRPDRRGYRAPVRGELVLESPHLWAE